MQPVKNSINNLISHINDPFLVKPAKKINKQNNFSKDELKELLIRINFRLKTIQQSTSLGNSFNVSVSQSNVKIRDKIERLIEAKLQIDNYLGS